MARGPIEGPVAVQSAIRYANQKSEQLLSEPQFGALRDRIVALFIEEKLTSLQIAESLNGDLELRTGVAITTASSIIRRMLQVLVDDDTRSAVHSVLHAKAIDRRRSEIDDARDRWMLEQGMKVWTEAQDEFFIKLIKKRSMKKGQVSNHPKIAIAMCKQFGEGMFTADDCRRHLEALRRSGRVPFSTVPRKRNVMKAH